MARVALLLLLHPLLSELDCRRWNVAAGDPEEAGGRDPRLDRPFIVLVEPSALQVTVTNRSRADGFVYFRVNLPYPDCANPEVVGRYDVSLTILFLPQDAEMAPAQPLASYGAGDACWYNGGTYSIDVPRDNWSAVWVWVALFYDQVVISEDAARAIFVRDNAAMAACPSSDLVGSLGVQRAQHWHRGIQDFRRLRTSVVRHNARASWRQLLDVALQLGEKPPDERSILSSVRGSLPSDVRTTFPLHLQLALSRKAWTLVGQSRIRDAVFCFQAATLVRRIHRTTDHRLRAVYDTVLSFFLAYHPLADVRDIQLRARLLEARKVNLQGEHFTIFSDNTHRGALRCVFSHFEHLALNVTLLTSAKDAQGAEA